MWLCFTTWFRMTPHNLICYSCVCLFEHSMRWSVISSIFLLHGLHIHVNDSVFFLTLLYCQPFIKLSHFMCCQCGHSSHCIAFWLSFTSLLHDIHLSWGSTSFFCVFLPFLETVDSIVFFFPCATSDIALNMSYLPLYWMYHLVSVMWVQICSVVSQYFDVLVFWIDNSFFPKIRLAIAKLAG